MNCTDHLSSVFISLYGGWYSHCPFWGVLMSFQSLSISTVSVPHLMPIGLARGLLGSFISGSIDTPSITHSGCELSTPENNSMQGVYQKNVQNEGVCKRAWYYYYTHSNSNCKGKERTRRYLNTSRTHTVNKSVPPITACKKERGYANNISKNNIYIQENARRRAWYVLRIMSLQWTQFMKVPSNSIMVGKMSCVATGEVTLACFFIRDGACMMPGTRNPARVT